MWFNLVGQFSKWVCLQMIQIGHFKIATTQKTLNTRKVLAKTFSAVPLWKYGWKCGMINTLDPFISFNFQLINHET